MTEYVSEIKTIPYSDENVFRALSDLSNLELVKDKIPADKSRNFTFDKDRCSFRVDPVGEVTFVIVEREPNKLVKLETENLPFKINLWIQLASKAERDTKMKLTLRADLNPMIKPMVAKPMREAVEKIAEAVSQVPYDKIV